MILSKLKDKQLIQPPDWLISNTHYLTKMGSFAYGVNNDESDLDVYGFCIPPKDIVFPHLAGEIFGFGRQIQRFEQWQQHHIEVEKTTRGAFCPTCATEISASKVATPNEFYYYCNFCDLHHEPEKCKAAVQTYDFSVYNIVKYFQLCMENNPNMIDSLFTDHTCIIHCTAVGNIMRDNRKVFLHKGAWHKFKGYAYSQMKKINTKESGGKRAVLVEEFGYDTKYAYHLVRLMLEVEQILIEGDLDLRRNAEQLKAIRRGEWTLEQLEEYFHSKEKSLEDVYTKSTLPYSPQEDKIKHLLLNCLEHHYGSIADAVAIKDRDSMVVKEIKAILEKYKV